MRELEANQLWCIEEPMPLAGLQFGARLTLARLRDQSLWVYAPFAISDEDEAAIRAQGEVKNIVAPNPFHFKQIGEFCARFPDAQLWVVPALSAKVEAPHLKLSVFPPQWEADFNGVLFDAALAYEEWVFCHRATRSLIVTDLIMNVPRPNNPLGRISSALLDEGRGAKPSRLVRTSIRAGRQMPKARAQIHQILRWDFKRIVMAHGNIVAHNGKRVFRRGFGWL